MVKKMAMMIRHEGHAHGEFDPHIWLDPINAKVILFEMSKHLIENDPKKKQLTEII